MKLEKYSTTISLCCKFRSKFSSENVCYSEQLEKVLYGWKMLKFNVNFGQNCICDERSFSEKIRKKEKKLFCIFLFFKIIFFEIFHLLYLKGKCFWELGKIDKILV